MILVSGQDHTATGKPGLTMDEITAYLPGLSPRSRTRNCASGSTAAGCRRTAAVLVLREIEKRLGLAARLAGCLSDARDPASTTHSYADMIGARMFAIACGYEDCDDLDVLRFDPAFKLACGRLPESGRDLMSQPTLSQARERPIMARTGAHGADDDRSVLRQLRARAPTHRARH